MTKRKVEESSSRAVEEQGRSSRLRDFTTPRLRIAHLADTHLGYTAYGKADPESGRNQRAVDIELSFEAAISDILTRDVDLVVHAGDVFHHTRPSWSTLTHFLRQMRRLELAGIPAVVIAGNHDTPRLRTTGSVFALLALALPGITFIARYEPEEVSFSGLDVVVHGIPHGALTNPDPPAVLLHTTLRNVAVTHGIAPGFASWAGREAGEAELRGNVIDSQFDYVALGHVHLRGEAGINARYSGSTERTSWGDQAAQPGYALVTLGERGDVPQVEYIDLPARPMETLAPIDGAERSARDLADMVLARAGALGKPHAMVRVELQNTPRPLFRETDAIVRRELGGHAWHIRLTAPGDLLDPLGRDAISGLAGLHPLALFEDFVRKQTDAGVYDKEFAERFQDRGRAALESGIRRTQETAPVEGAAP
ncbi:MAG: metallophosphoesterase family protein [Thermomicrobiales bacterium]